MKKNSFKAKIIFLVLFAILLGLCIYDDAIKSSPRSLINIFILAFMMNAYLDKNENLKKLKNDYKNLKICPNAISSQKFENDITQNSILNNIPLPAFIIDTDGKYIIGNTKLKELIGVTESELNKKNICTKYLGQNCKKIREEIAYILSCKENIILEHFYKFSTHSPSWYRIHKSPIINQNGEINQIAVFIEDIGAKKLVERQKEHYIATLSHDLKTPIIAQIRSLELILKGGFGQINSNQKDLLQLTLDSCKGMYSLVSAILFSYKFDNNEIKLNSDEINITELLLECCVEVSNLAKERNIEIIINPDLIQNNINADIKFLKYAMLYFIENGVSHAYENSQVIVNLYEENDEIAMTVNTEGPYIPPKDIRYMFDQYLGQTKTYNKIGFCLKLYYSSQIIRAHNGKVFITSDPSNKNILGFKIPRAAEKITAIA